MIMNANNLYQNCMCQKCRDTCSLATWVKVTACVFCITIYFVTLFGVVGKNVTKWQVPFVYSNMYVMY